MKISSQLTCRLVSLSAACLRTFASPPLSAPLCYSHAKSLFFLPYSIPFPSWFSIRLFFLAVIPLTPELLPNTSLFSVLSHLSDQKALPSTLDYAFWAPMLVLLLPNYAGPSWVSVFSGLSLCRLQLSYSSRRILYRVLFGTVYVSIPVIQISTD